MYPHNTVLDALMSTGLAGTSLLLAVLVSSLYTVMQKARRHAIYAWIACLYVQSQVGATTSGAIFYDPMFWTTVGVAFGLRAATSARVAPARARVTARRLVGQVELSTQ